MQFCEVLHLEVCCLGVYVVHLQSTSDDVGQEVNSLPISIQKELAIGLLDLKQCHL